GNELEWRLSEVAPAFASRISRPLSIHSTGHCESCEPVLSMHDSTNVSNRSTTNHRYPMLRHLFLTFVGFASTALLTTALTAQTTSSIPPAGFAALFNGQDLTGWKGL